MITDKQFEDAFTAAGGWFFLVSFEIIYHWHGSKAGLIDELYTKGFDSSKSGTTTRVSSALRIIQNQRGKEALTKIRNSSRINQMHPGARDTANELLKKYY